MIIKCHDTILCYILIVGYTEWCKYCRLYAQQLKQEGYICKAATYLLYTHDVETALLWLTENNCYRYVGECGQYRR